MISHLSLEALARRLPAGAEPLTAREWEVAATVAQGATNREASRKLYLSEKTIEMHLTRVYRKLGVRSRCQLVVLFAKLAAAAAAPVQAELRDDRRRYERC